MLINKYEKKKDIESNKTSLKKKSRIAKKIENNKNEICAFNKHCEKYICNYHFALKTFFAYSMFFKVREIKRNRREHIKTNQILF